MNATVAFASLALLSSSLLPAKPPQAIAADQFASLHALCKTQAGESRFWDLPWMIQLDAALKRGAAEGKPIFVWCGAGGAPVGVC